MPCLPNDTHSVRAINIRVNNDDNQSMNGGKVTLRIYQVWGLMEVSAIVIVLKPVNVPCEETVSLSQRHDTADNIHIMTPREKKSIFFFQRKQGASSNCCMALSTSPNTLLQIHTTRQGSTFSTGHRGASPTAPLLNEAIRPHPAQLVTYTNT